MTEEEKENEGHTYEQKFMARLVAEGMAASGHKTGKNSNDALICDFFTELKYTTVAHFYQNVLHWSVDKGWHIGHLENGKELAGILDHLTRPVMDYVNEKWGEPVKRWNHLHGEVKNGFNEDRKRFRNLPNLQNVLSIPPEDVMEIVRAHYWEERCAYIQVGGSGLFHFYKDWGDFKTPRFEGGQFEVRVRRKTTSTKDQDYHFQLQIEGIKSKPIPKSSLDLDDEDMLQQFIKRHRDGFVSGKWKQDNYDMLYPLYQQGFITFLPPRELRHEQVPKSLRGKKGPIVMRAAV